VCGHLPYHYNTDNVHTCYSIDQQFRLSIRNFRPVLREFPVRYTAGADRGENVSETFLMKLEWDLDGFSIPEDRIVESVQPMATKLRMEHQVMALGNKTAVFN
jgi:hypothetical protein